VVHGTRTEELSGVGSTFRAVDHQVTYDLATGFDPFHRVRVDTSALAGAAEHDLAAAVAGCPGWTVADLAWYVLEVQFFWATVVADRLQDPDGYTEPPRPADTDLAPALRDGVGAGAHPWGRAHVVGTEHAFVGTAHTPSLRRTCRGMCVVAAGCAWRGWMHVRRVPPAPRMPIGARGAW
jgi:hypothetical protein